MSIRASAYEFCKAVMKASLRTELREIVDSLNRASGGPENRTNRSHFGYVARKQRAQFLGYLLVDQARDSLSRRTPGWPIPPLQGEERRLLAIAHGQILQVNQQCIAPLAEALPTRVKAVDPYSRFPQVPFADAREVSFVDQRAVSAMANSFHEHPAIEIALQGIGLVQEQASEDEYAKAVFDLTECLLHKGPLDAPEQFTEIAYRDSASSPRRTIARQLAALMSIRSSLRTLDQLVYQAVLSDKLSLLSDDNVINIAGPIRHPAGQGIRVVYQPSEEAQLIEKMQLLLVKCSRPTAPLEELVRAESVEVEVSQGLGEAVTVEFRVINENLNPFGPTIKHF